MLYGLLVAALMGADVKAKLAGDIVTVHDDGSMTAEMYKICKQKSGNSEQVHFSAHAAPGTGISRDKFVFFYGYMSMKFMAELGDCKNLSAPIGELDADIKLYMNEAGMQFSITAEGKTKRFSSTWDDL